MSRIKELDSQLATMASKHVAPEHIDTALGALADHINGLDSGDMTALQMDPDLAQKHCDWFLQKHAANNPEQARAKKFNAKGYTWK